MNRRDQSVFNRKVIAIVPPDYVLTPGGYRHRSLVHFVPKGHRIEKDQGRTRQFEVATGNRLASYGSADTGVLVPDVSSGWITYSSWSNESGSPIVLFVTTWQVPPAPATQNGQTVFLFNSLLDSAEDDILQPVLQWGVSHAGGGNFWAIANWYVDSSGHASFSTLEQVAPGDVLIGTITLEGRDRNGGFNYLSSFANHPGSDLGASSMTELVWATETLEAYRISRCSDYPGAPLTAMNSIQIHTENGIDPALNWAVTNRVSDCNQSSSVVNPSNPGGQIDIFY
jgi:hypothetical protein